MFPWLRHKSGSAAVEAAIILPLLLLLLTALFDLGFAGWEAMQVQSAADAGAQYATRNPWNVSQISAAVTSATGASGVSANPAPSQFCGCPTGGTLVAISCTSKCANGDTPSLYGQVNAQMTHFTVLHYPGLAQPLTLTGTAIARLQ